MVTVFRSRRLTFKGGNDLKKIIIFSFLIFIVSGCHFSSESMPKEMPDDFNFSLQFGVARANELNTYENTFTKDLVEAGTAMTNMTLTEEEMRIIYEKFKEADVINLPNKKDGNTCQAPYDQFLLEMTIDGEEYILVWDHSCLSRAKMHWEEVMKFLQEEIIFPKEEYKQLPDFVGGYD